MSIKKKVVFLPYDFDTAIGINNEGSLVFGYSLEDIDQTAGGADVFNGQQSVLWKNMRAAFAQEIKAMYQTLRSNGALSYTKVEEMFEEHQGKWPEAIFNEDAWFKYLAPLVEKGNASYLSMLQGSKAEQRKWWLYNRFRYIDSKYNAGDALTDVITLRGYAKSNVTVTPYADIYASVKYGSYLVQTRAERGTAYTLVCPLDSVNDTEIYIYSASQLASVGDLSGLMVGYADLSSAVKLQDLKLGDGAETYSNGNLTELHLGNNTLLRTLDVRNCPHLTQAVDITGCRNIEKVYFDGTAITGLALPIGGVLDTLSLPSTITNLTVRNQPKLTSFTLAGGDYSNISTCRIENTDYFLKNQSRIAALVSGLPDRSRLRLVGLDIDWLADVAAINTWYDSLARFRGLDINGENLDNAYIEGVIHINSAKGSDIAALLARYPYMRIDAAHTESYIYYYNGSTLLTPEKVLDGGDGSYTGTTPTKAQDAQYTYSFAGWSKDDDNTVDADALTAVVADRNVYACFTGTLRKYTVTFVKSSTDGGGTLQTINNVNYGTTITAASSYTGATPTTTQGDATDYPFEGWEPASATVQGNTTFTAKFGSPIEVAEITDSWDTIIANIDNGTYSTKYKVGNYKPLDLGTEGTINMQIVAMDADELADGSSTAPLTFIGMELLNTYRPIENSSKQNSQWATSSLRDVLNTSILELIPTAVKNRIQTVNKPYLSFDGSVLYSTDKLWIPSAYEVIRSPSYGSENTGVQYTSVFNNDDSRIKKSKGTAFAWFLRTHHSRNLTDYETITLFGTESFTTSTPTSSKGVALGFCLGLEQETITDDWSTILSNTNYATDYSIGDTKMLDLGTEGKHLMEIVAFDEDDRADGNGKAGITWISKTLLNHGHRMNPSNSSGAIGTGGNGGWENCEMRTYLKDTIKPLIPETVRNAIVEVTKRQSTVTDGTMIKDGQTTTDDVWIPSAREVSGSSTCESTGAVYTTKFNSTSARIKKKEGSVFRWWSRSATSIMYYMYVTDSGGNGNNTAAYSYGIALGFCTN